MIKQDFSGKTNMDDDQRRQLGDLACVVFCTKKQKRRKPIKVISWLRRQYAMVVKILNIQLLKLPGLVWSQGVFGQIIICNQSTDWSLPYLLLGGANWALNWLNLVLYGACVGAVLPN